MEKNIKKIYLLLGIGITIISFSGILIKISSAPPLIIAFYRMLFSMSILTPIFIIKHRKEAHYFLDYRPILGGFFLALHFFIWITSFQYTSVANAVLFIALQPLFTLFLELIFAREDLRTGIIHGLILTLIGSFIVSIGDLNLLFDKVWGDLLATVAALFAGIYLFIGRSLREKVNYFPYIYILYTYTTVFLLIFTLIKSIPLSGYARVNYLYFLAMALGPTLIGHSALNYSVRFLPTTIVSLSILGEPILTTIFAWILLGEKITTLTFIGGLFIIVGIYRAVVKGNKIVEIE
ncbi:MAG: DMT family transporter [Firmicutes bacterium]|nr:DMT family transporter [Bacillota bacterium]